MTDLPSLIPLFLSSSPDGYVVPIQRCRECSVWRGRLKGAHPQEKEKEKKKAVLFYFRIILQSEIDVKLSIFFLSLRVLRIYLFLISPTDVQPSCESVRSSPNSWNAPLERADCFGDGHAEESAALACACVYFASIYRFHLQPATPPPPPPPPLFIFFPPPS